MGKKARVQFDFSERTMKLLEDLKELLDASSRAEVMRRSLRLMDYATSKNCKLVFTGKDGVEKDLMIF